MKTYETDVLVVGGGGAATASTIAAHDAGARTMLAVKGQFGVPGVRGAGATSNPKADFWTIRTVGPKGGLFNPPDLTYQDMLQAGLGLADPALCRIFVDEVTEAIKRLRSMGMRFQSKMLATMPATKESKGTNNIVQIQKAVIAGTNTQVLEHANLTDLIVDQGRCRGAVGIDDEGNPFVVHAGAVIMATGGVGQLFKYSFNPPGNTGDGYAMALRAGAALFNMEFMQQGLATTWPTQCMVMLYEMEEPYRLLNRHGKAFLADYLPDGLSVLDASKLKAYHWPVSCRDAAIHLDRAIHGEVLAGRGTEHDAVFLDLSGTQRGFQPEVFDAYMKENGLDIGTDLLQVQLHHHTSNGGIRIDTDAQSPFVRGLFACGEAAGWQGADRLGGTMLGGSQVFGWRAGTKAAEVARERPQGDLHPDDFERLLGERLARQREAKGGTRPQVLHRALQQAMWERLLVEKDAQQLAQAQRFIDDQRGRMHEDLQIAEPFDHVLAFEQRNLLDVAEVITQAGTLRTESRGSHYRADHPERDDAHWLANIFVSRDAQGELVLRKQWINEEVGWEDQGRIRIMPWG
ncbi:FAD-binding protein [Paraliomyxa miuraensis]|uniref:FAD-binding protein n=1 Tax=Paraliomyxa miuraensis TaxID=376150 RepID=UPI00224CACC7|nr:FAD-binding protein [Paraliomyxa miuraensis]MCX4240768.1 FAD-binding protein [Paraliomyxa miuraensis]